MKNKLKLSFLWLLILVFTLSPFPLRNQWELIKDKGVINYGTRTSLLSYFEVGDEIIGYEFRLLHDFAEKHNLKLVTKVYQNNGDLLNDLALGHLDIAGGHLSATKQRREKFSFSEPISHTAIDLVTHYKYRNLESVSDFESLRGLLIANSSYEELLSDLPHFYPHNLTSSSSDSLFELFRKINKKEIDFTFADSEITSIYQKFIPGVYQPIQLSPRQDIVFLTPKYRTNQLLIYLNEFIQSAHNSNKIQTYKSEIISHLPQIDVADTVTFFDKLQTQWPLIKKHVFAVADKLDFDPAMLAAISYQESHWDPDAVSISGVRGLMMLTESTAEEMNVTDRTDPIESLMGGVKYFRKMKAKIPKRIVEPDRTLFALAAYNVGFGHLEDARILAQKAGEDPDIWLEVEPYLSKLNNPAIAHELNYGVADGKTAVIYVNNIMTFKQLMTWKMQKENIKKNDGDFL